MAYGDSADMARRLYAVLPRWFPDVSASPVVAGVVSGVSAAMAQVYTLYAYAVLQTRIQTATDGFLDIISADYFGSGLPRAAWESDAAFRSRIRAALFPERATRNGMVKALTALTGQPPIIFEPARTADAFCLGVGGLGVGALGSYTMPNQAFITVYQPAGAGGGGIAGLGCNYAGLGSPAMALPSTGTLAGAVTSQNIYDTIEATRPVASIMWVNIANA